LVFEAALHDVAHLFVKVRATGRREPVRSVAVGPQADRPQNFVAQLDRALIELLAARFLEFRAAILGQFAPFGIAQLTHTTNGRARWPGRLLYPIQRNTAWFLVETPVTIIVPTCEKVDEMMSTAPAVVPELTTALPTAGVPLISKAHAPHVC